MGNVRPLFDLGPLQECSAKSKHAHANTERPTPHETTGSCSNSIPVPPRHSSTWPRGASRAVRLQRLPTSTGYRRRSLLGMKDFRSSTTPSLGLPAALFLLLFAVTAYFGYYALSLLLELFSVPGGQPVLLLRALVGATSAAIVLGFIVRSASLWSPELYLFLAFWLLYSFRIIADVQGSRVLLDREPCESVPLLLGAASSPAVTFPLAPPPILFPGLQRPMLSACHRLQARPSSYTNSCKQDKTYRSRPSINGFSFNTNPSQGTHRFKLSPANKSLYASATPTFSPAPLSASNLPLTHLGRPATAL